MECLLLYPYAPVDIELTIPLKHSDIDLLQDAVISCDDCFSDMIVDLFFSYLFSVGYLDVVRMNQSDYFDYSFKHSVTIPNLVHRNQLYNKLRNYYNQTFNRSVNVFKPYARKIPAAQKALQKTFGVASKKHNLDGDATITMRTAKHTLQQKLQAVVKAPPHAKFTSSLPLNSNNVMQGSEDLCHSISNHMTSALKVK